jgi:hypothetical protein
MRDGLTVTADLDLPFFSGATRRRCSNPEWSIYMLMRMSDGELLAFNRHYALLGRIGGDDARIWKRLRRHSGVTQFERGREWRGRRGDAIWFDRSERRAS